MSEVLEKIKITIAEFDEKRKALLSQLQHEFAPMLQPLFENNPKIESIGWTQYTPYFNDGDECVFSVNKDYLYINGEHEDEIDNLDRGTYETITADNIDAHKAFNSGPDGYSWYASKQIGDRGYFPNPQQDKELANGITEFKNILNSIPEDFYKDLFGDHLKVTVSKSGEVITEHYSHD